MCVCVCVCVCVYIYIYIYIYLIKIWEKRNKIPIFGVIKSVNGILTELMMTGNPQIPLGTK